MDALCAKLFDLIVKEILNITCAYVPTYVYERGIYFALISEFSSH